MYQFQYSYGIHTHRMSNAGGLRPHRQTHPRLHLRIHLPWYFHLHKQSTINRINTMWMLRVSFNCRYNNNNSYVRLFGFFVRRDKTLFLGRRRTRCLLCYLSARPRVGCVDLADSHSKSKRPHAPNEHQNQSGCFPNIRKDISRTETVIYEFPNHKFV